MFDLPRLLHLSCLQCAARLSPLIALTLILFTGTYAQNPSDSTQSRSGRSTATPSPSPSLPTPDSTPAVQIPTTPVPSPSTSLSATLERNRQWVFLALAALIATGIVLLFYTSARIRRRRKALLYASTQTSRDAAIGNTLLSAAEEIKAEAARLMPVRVMNAPRTDAVTPNTLDAHSVSFPTEKTGKQVFEEIGDFRQVAVIPIRVARDTVETTAVNSPIIPKPVDTERAVAEIRRLLDGETYNEAVINASDAVMRRLVGAELFAAIAGQNYERRENALRGFTKHGYFDEIVRDLTEAEDAGKRASAARVLGIIRDPASVAALMAALKDNSEEVRDAISEVLAELRNSESEPLESSDERDEDRDAPQAMIQPSIDTHVAPDAIEPVASSALRAFEEISGDTESNRVVTEPTEIKARETYFAPIEIQPTQPTVVEAAGHDAQAAANSSLADPLENVHVEEPSPNITSGELKVSDNEPTPLADVPAVAQLTDSQLSANEAGMVDLTSLYSVLDDSSPEIRDAAAQTLHDASSSDDHIQFFRRVLREAAPERRRQIGAAIAASGLAGVAISNLTNESQEKSYEAFSLLFLMAKAGEIEPLTRAIETHPYSGVRLPVMKLLALSGQQDAVPLFRRLAVRGLNPFDVRVAAMEAIYQISEQPASKQMSDARC